MSGATYTSIPVMRCIPALVTEPIDFLMPPIVGRSFISIGASEDPETAGQGLMFIGIQASSGQFLTAILSEEALPAMADLLSAAAEQIRTRTFEQPCAGGVQ